MSREDIENILKDLNFVRESYDLINPDHVSILAALDRIEGFIGGLK